MALYPQLDTVLALSAIPVTLRLVTHTVSDYGSPVESLEDWLTQGVVTGVSAEDEPFYQGLLAARTRKCYMRAAALATQGNQTKTVSELQPKESDRMIVDNVEYRIVAVRNYERENGLLVFLLASEGVGG